jgi:hypothetical protein
LLGRASGGDPRHHRDEGDPPPEHHQEEGQVGIRLELTDRSRPRRCRQRHRSGPSGRRRTLKEFGNFFI